MKTQHIRALLTGISALLMLVHISCKKGSLTVYEPEPADPSSVKQLEETFLTPFREGEVWELTLRPKGNDSTLLYHLLRKENGYVMRGTSFSTAHELAIDLKAAIDGSRATLWFSDDGPFPGVITAMDYERTRGADSYYTFMRWDADTLILEGDAYADQLTMVRIDPKSEKGKAIIENPMGTIRQRLSTELLRTPFFSTPVDDSYALFTADVNTGKLYHFSGWKGKALQYGVTNLAMRNAIRDTLYLADAVRINNGTVQLDMLIYDPQQAHWYFAGSRGEDTPVRLPLVGQSIDQVAMSPWNVLAYLNSFIDLDGDNAPASIAEANVAPMASFRFEDVGNGNLSGWSSEARAHVERFATRYRERFLGAQEQLYSLGLSYIGSQHQLMITLAIRNEATGLVRDKDEEGSLYGGIALNASPTFSSQGIRLIEDVRIKEDNALNRILAGDVTFEDLLGGFKIDEELRAELDKLVLIYGFLKELSLLDKPLVTSWAPPANDSDPMGILLTSPEDDRLQLRFENRKLTP